QRFALDGDETESLAADWSPCRLEPWSLNWGQIERQVPGAKARRQAWQKAIIDFDDKAIAALNYVNGARTISQIARLVSGELGQFSVADTLDLFEVLVE